MMDPRISGWLSTFPFSFPSDPPEALELAPGPLALGEFTILIDGRFAGLILAAPELGCWVDQRYQRQGVATRAAVLALSRYFAQGGGASRARSLPGNHAMRRFLSGLGFREIPELGTGPHGVVLHRLSQQDFALAQPFALTTRRTMVSAVVAEDLPALYDIAMRRDVLGCHPLLHSGLSPEAFAAHFSSFGAGLAVHAAIRIRDRIVGFVSVSSAPDCELCLVLSPEVWGLGIATEVVSAFCTEIFDRFIPEALFARVSPENLAAMRVLDHAGFRAVAKPRQPGLESRGQAPELRHFRLDRPDDL